MSRPQLTDAEQRDIKLWFGWGAILGYPTSPSDYLRAMLARGMRSRFLEQPRPKRKAILRFVIEEHDRRCAPSCGRRGGNCQCQDVAECSFEK